MPSWTAAWWSCLPDTRGSRSLTIALWTTGTARGLLQRGGGGGGPGTRTAKRLCTKSGQINITVQFFPQ